MKKLHSIIVVSFLIGFGGRMAAQSDSISQPSRLLFVKFEDNSSSEDRYLVDNSKRAFFCRLEDKNDKKSKIGLKFRLGSVQYVDYLEYGHLLNRQRIIE